MDMLAGCTNPKDLRAALDKPRADVNAIYKDAMDRIGKQDKELAHRVLIWIIYARQQLSVEELRHAVSTSPGMVDHDIDPDSLVPKELLTSVCAGLVIADKNSRDIHLVRK